MEIQINPKCKFLLNSRVQVVVHEIRVEEVVVLCSSSFLLSEREGERERERDHFSGSSAFPPRNRKIEARINFYKEIVSALI